MGRKIKLKKKKKLIKERPFDDSDTEIQIRPDYMVDYTREDPMRMAEADPVLDRILTKEIEADIEYEDEDDDIGVRTREKHLPTMPTDIAFTSNMKDAQDPTATTDLQMSVRYYNDAIRSNTESAKIFIMGLIRQLRRWIEVQVPDPTIEPDTASLYWIKDTLMPSMRTEMLVLERHFNPEIDLEYFRRWRIEGAILERELQNQIDQGENAALELRAQGHDPHNPGVPREVDIPENNVLNWVENNPGEAKEALNNPNQTKLLSDRILSEFFSDPALIGYLEHQESIKIQAGFDGQHQSSLIKLLKAFQTKNITELQSLAAEFELLDIESEFSKAVSVVGDLSSVVLEMIQFLMKTTGKTGSAVQEQIETKPDDLINLIIP
jgi:hypothetical protein